MGALLVSCFCAVFLGADVSAPPATHLCMGGGGEFVRPSSPFSLPRCIIEHRFLRGKVQRPHPLLGHLVMKHGGHKDLAKLASLARIESETGARATFAIESLPRHPLVAALPPWRERVGPPPPPRRERVGPPPPPPPRGARQHPPARWSRRGRQARPAQRPLYNAMRQAAADVKRRCISPIGAWLLAVPLLGADCGSQSTPPAPDNGGRQARWAREVEDAAKDMRRWVPRFCMVYVSPVHVRECSGELAAQRLLSGLSTAG